jgi:hypothetical protein
MSRQALYDRLWRCYPNEIDVTRIPPPIILVLQNDGMSREGLFTYIFTLSLTKEDENIQARRMRKILMVLSMIR